MLIFKKTACTLYFGVFGNVGCEFKLLGSIYIRFDSEQIFQGNRKIKIINFYFQASKISKFGSMKLEKDYIYHESIFELHYISKESEDYPLLKFVMDKKLVKFACYKICFLNQ